MSLITSWQSEAGVPLAKLPMEAAGETLACKVESVENATSKDGLQYVAVWLSVRYKGSQYAYRHALFSQAHFSHFARFARLPSGSSPAALEGCMFNAFFSIRDKYLNIEKIDK